jgi:hypothetical protein
MVGERELTTALLAKEASFPPENPDSPAGFLGSGHPGEGRRGFGPALTPPVQASSLSL